MAQYIDKAAVVAEIKKRKKEWQYGSSIEAKYKREECDDILSFIEALEVKEVDLDFEQELYKAFGQVKDFTLGMRIAKHFFELGLKTQKGEQL